MCDWSFLAYTLQLLYWISTIRKYFSSWHADGILSCKSFGAFLFYNLPFTRFMEPYYVAVGVMLRLVLRLFNILKYGHSEIIFYGCSTFVLIDFKVRFSIGDYLLLFNANSLGVIWVLILVFHWNIVPQNNLLCPFIS